MKELWLWWRGGIEDGERKDKVTRHDARNRKAHSASIRGDEALILDIARFGTS